MAEPFDVEAATDDQVLDKAGVELPPEPEEMGPLKPIADVTPIEAIAGFMAFVAVTVSIVAVVMERSIIVILAGVMTVLVGPYAYLQQTQLTDLAALKETTEFIGGEVNRLKESNQRLEGAVGELGDTIDGLQGVENTLEVITATENQNVAVLEEQTEENKKILVKMRKNTKGRVIQNFITMIYRGDENMDDMIDEDEVAKVEEGLESISGVEVHHDRLVAAIAGKSIDSVVGVVRNLMSDDTPEDQRIFEIN